MDTSDEPHGLLTITPSSLTTEERHQTINIYVNREFGASGLYAEKDGKIKVLNFRRLNICPDCVQGQ